jgi:hypothetical protein
MIRRILLSLLLALPGIALAQIGPGPVMIPNLFSNPALFCTGGTVTSSGGKRIHTFNSSSSLVCTGTGSADYLIVAGGGGGGGASATPLPVTVCWHRNVTVEPTATT